MRVLIVVASKHGATRGIADEVAAELSVRGLEPTVVSTTTLTDVFAFDAVIVGSAVYMGRWMDEAKRFVEMHRAELSTKPVWLFSSGPTGPDDSKVTEPADAPKYAEMIGARGQRTFHGRLEPETLGVREKLIVKAVHAPTGDFRNWETIRRWADEIATALQPVTTSIASLPTPGKGSRRQDSAPVDAV